MPSPLIAALSAFKTNPSGEGWKTLPFFNDGQAEHILEKIDQKITAGAHVLPPPEQVFNAFVLTPFNEVKVVILGQDPYPTPGDAHGLAFSYIGRRRLPASLQTIFQELSQDLGIAVPRSGDLSAWAKQGVLLLNSALTVEVGAAGVHLKMGWSSLTDQAISELSARRPHIVFMLWGASARKRSVLIDQSKHLVLEAGHPSPLNRLRDFQGTKPFSKANEWLTSKGEAPIDWHL